MRYVIGDVHGSFAKLKKVLDMVGFDRSRDILFCVGDICDRGDENLNCLRYFYSLGSSFRSVFGNHDVWLYRFLLFEEVSECWDGNGGEKTIFEFCDLPKSERKEYARWIGGFPYMLKDGNAVIAHNFIPSSQLASRIGTDAKPEMIVLQDAFETGLLQTADYDTLIFDRTIADFIIMKEMNFKAEGVRGYSEVKFQQQFGMMPFKYIMGHTPYIDGVHSYGNLMMIDTGAFVKKEIYRVRNDGFMTIVNLDTGEILDSRADAAKS